MAADDVTLGEVNRNVEGLRRDLGDLTKEVIELKIKAGTNEDRTRRLEGIVYGAVGVAIAGLITAVISVINNH